MRGKRDDYPKTVDVPFLGEDAAEDMLLACYALLNTSGTRPEITIMAKKHVSIRDSIRYSMNPVVMTLSRTSGDTFEDFHKEYMEHRSGVTAVVSLDKKDKLRISINYPVEEMARDAGIPIVLTATVYDSKTEAGLNDFFLEWEEKYQELKAQ